MFSCNKCKKTLWVKYFKIYDTIVLCPECYRKAKIQLKTKFKQDPFKTIIHNFFKKYQHSYSPQDLEKLSTFIENKFDLYFDPILFKEIILEMLKEYELHNELVEFEKELMSPINEPIQEKQKYFCSFCNSEIDGRTFEFSKKHFNKPLCLKHQGPRPQQNLYYALRNRGIKCEYEFFDGHKHIDIAIHQAQLFLEIDGRHHLIDPKQFEADLKRTIHSQYSGYITRHISNTDIETNLNEIADSIA